MRPTAALFTARAVVPPTLSSMAALGCRFDGAGYRRTMAWRWCVLMNPACPSIGVADSVYVLIESGSVSVGLLNVAATEFIESDGAGRGAGGSQRGAVADRRANIGPLVIRNTSDSVPSRRSYVGNRLLRRSTSRPGRPAAAGLSESVMKPRWSRSCGTGGEGPLERLQAMRLRSARAPGDSHVV